MKKISLFILVFVLFCNLTNTIVFANQRTWTQNTSGVFSGGDGSEGSPFLINTPEQFANIANITEEFYYKLESDLTLNELSDCLNWETNPPQNEWISFDFSGYLDGNGHAIKGIYIKSDNLTVGLFNNVYKGKISNLTISDSYIVGNGNVGGIVGNLSDAIVENCIVKNSYIEGKYNVGGVIGQAIISVENGIDETYYINGCYNYADIYSYGESHDAGGIVGYSQNLNIKNSYNYGNVETRNLNRAGGIAGRTTGLIEKCYNYGSVQSEDFAAGIVALTDNDINNCNNYADVMAKTAGGIAAWGSMGSTDTAPTKINNCVNEGNISGISKDYSSSYTGGILGFDGEIYNCNNKGNIYSNNGETGGIVGGIRKKTIIKNCYNEGNVDGTNSRVGGIIGSIICYNTTNISDCVIENCNNKGNLGSSSEYIGGIIGKCDSFGYPLIIIDCYNDANIECSNNYVGGIAGYLTSGQKICNSFNSGIIIGNLYVGGILGQHAYEIDINENSSISNCYNSGRIYAESIFGGIAGQIYGKISFIYNSGEINNSNDTQLLGRLQNTTIIQNGYSISTYTDLQKNKLSSQDMMLQKYYQNFDFDNVWEFSEDAEYNYPVFKNCLHQPHSNNIIPIKLIVDKLPNKTVYNAGDNIDLSNMSIACEYSDGSTKNIRYYINQYPYDVAFPNENNIILSYCGLKAYIPITINSDRISAKFNSGDGTFDSPYIITTAKEMAYLALTVNAGFDNYKDKYICVNNDISLDTDENYNWISIGTSDRPFMGHFNGNNKIISNMYINNDKDYQGLFGYVKNGSVSNVIVADSFIKANSYIGAIIGKNDAEDGKGYISNCHNTIDVEGNNFVGGIVGHNSPSSAWGNPTTTDIYNCTNLGRVKGNAYVGGIAGWHNSLVDSSVLTHSINYGNIISTYESFSYCGGIAGTSARGTITSCINHGDIKGESSYVGGVTGSNENTVTDCINYGAIQGKGRTSGLIGDNREILYEENNFNYSYVNDILEITDEEHKGIIVKTINSDESIKINLTANNYDNSSEQIFIGIYDSNNRLLSVEQYSNLNNSEMEIEKNTSKRFVKIFYWKDNFQPLSIALFLPCA